MIEVIRFMPEHAVTMSLRDPDSAWVNNIGAPVEAQARVLACGPAVTMLRDGDVVACGGVTLLWRDVAEAWMRTSPLVEAHPVALVRTVRRFLGTVWRNLALKRLQCVVRSDYDRALRFAEHVGFRREAILHRYGPDGADYIMCARIA